MWLLYENGEVIYRLLAAPISSEVRLGRSQQCEVVLHDNVRLSRVCATIKASAVKANTALSADKATYTLTVTDTSKLGILLNNEPIAAKSSQSLLNDDVLQFVGDDSDRQYKVRWHGMVLCESAIAPKHRPVVSAATAAVGCTFTKTYSEACTHVLFGSLQPTPKVFHAIIDQKPVVSIAFLQQLTSTDHIREPLPSPAAFVPHTNDASVRAALTIAAEPDGKQRDRLFHDKSIVFVLQKSYDDLDSVIQAVGAKQSLVAPASADKQWWQELGDFVLVQPTVNKRSLKSSQTTQASQLSHATVQSHDSDVASLITHLQQQCILDETGKGLTDQRTVTSAIVLADTSRIQFTRVSATKITAEPAEVITLVDSVELVHAPADPTEVDHHDVHSVTSDTTAATIVLDQPAIIANQKASDSAAYQKHVNHFAASPDDHNSTDVAQNQRAADERDPVEVEEFIPSQDPFEHVPPEFVPSGTPLKAALESVDDRATAAASDVQPARRSGNRFAPSLMSRSRTPTSNANTSNAQGRSDVEEQPVATASKTADKADESSDDDTGWGVIPAKPTAPSRNSQRLSSDESKESQPPNKRRHDDNNFTSSKRRSMVDGMTLNAFGLGSPMPQPSGDELMGGSEPRNDRSQQDRYDFPAPPRASPKSASQLNGTSSTQNVKKFRKQWPKGYTPTPPSSAGE